MVEPPKQFQFGSDGKHQRQIVLVLVSHFFLFANDKILMFPQEGGLLFLTHLLSMLPLLLDLVGGATRTPFAAFVPLTFEAVFDRTHTVQNQTVDLLDDVKQAELMSMSRQ